MTSDIQETPIWSERLDEPVLAPCTECGKQMETKEIWRSYNDDWELTDEIVSITKCEPCYAAWRKKLDEHYADVARREAEAEARRQAIRDRIREAEPLEKQLGFEFAQD